MSSFCMIFIQDRKGPKSSLTKYTISSVHDSFTVREVHYQDMFTCPTLAQKESDQEV